MCRACRSGRRCWSPLPPATALSISQNGIQNIARRSKVRRPPPPFPAHSDLHQESKTMKDVLRRLGSDFLSTIVFLVVYLATDNVILATAVAILGAIGQVIWSRIKGQTLGYMTWASLGLVIVLGSATLLTHDPRFVLAKPAIGHAAIGLIMLKRGWMLRYMPPIVTDTIPEYVTFAGYAWAALCFALAAGTIAVASTGDMKLWAFYVTVVLVGAKLA